MNEHYQTKSNQSQSQQIEIELEEHLLYHPIEENQTQSENHQNQSEDHLNRSRRRTRTRTRTVTETYVHSARVERNLLNDELPPRSQTAIAYSSQQILATAIKPDPELSTQASINIIRIGFSILPINKRKIGSWYFTLPSPSIPPYKNRPSYRKSYQPLIRAEVDLLLFSHDGMYLLICSHTSSTFNDLGHLRISVLVQSHSQIDHWDLGFDEVICDWSIRGLLDNEPLEPNIKRVLKARFLGEPRKWSIERLNENSDQDGISVGHQNLKLSKPKKNCGSLIDNASQGKGPTVIMVLNTNELFVIHLPFRQSNLPPHVLLAPLGTSTITTGPLHLIPTPGSNRTDRKRTITDDPERRSSEEPIIIRNPKPVVSLPKNVGLGIMIESNKFPMNHQNQFNFSSFPSLEPPKLNSLNSSSSAFNEIPLLMTEKVNGEKTVQFNPNGFNQFDSMINDFRSNRKEITIASIGFPIHSNGSTSTSSSQPAPEERIIDELNDSVILIGFQSRTKPIIPTPIKQIILSNDHHQQRKDLNQLNHENHDEIEVDEEIGDYITGLGELDEAFIEDEKKTKPKPSQNEDLGLGLGLGLGMRMGIGIGIGIGLGMENERKRRLEEEEEEVEIENQEIRKRKSKLEVIKNLKQITKKKRKRFEPLIGIDESEDLAGAGNQMRFGLIEFVEVFIDFENGIIPTISIKPLPSIPILDPTESNEEIKIKLKSLEFLELNHSTSLSTSNSKSSSSQEIMNNFKPELILIVGYSREDLSLVDRLETWKIKFCRSELSNGFLGLECFGNGNGNNNNGNHSKIEIDHETILRGPEEWCFVRSLKKEFKIGEKIQRLISNWKGKDESFLCIISKEEEEKEAIKENSNELNDEFDFNNLDEDHQFECVFLDKRNLSEVIKRKSLKMSENEAKQIIISYFGSFTFSIDRNGKIRSIPLIREEDNFVLIKLILESVYNKERIDELVKILTDTDQHINFDLNEIFKTIEDYLNFESLLNEEEEEDGNGGVEDSDDLLLKNWNFEFGSRFSNWLNLGLDLWSAIDGYEKVAEIAFLLKQIQVILKIGITLKNELFGRSVWQFLSITKWFVNLCERIFDSVSPDSKNRHLSILITRESTIKSLIKLSIMISSIIKTLQNPKSLKTLINHHRLLPKFKGIHEMNLQEEIELGQKIFDEFLKLYMFFDLDEFVLGLKEIWKMSLNEEGFEKLSDDQSKNKKFKEGFMIPLNGINEDQIQISIKTIQKLIKIKLNFINFEKLNNLKELKIKEKEEEIDLIRLIKIKSNNNQEENQIRKCSKCGNRSIENLRFFKKTLIDSNHSTHHDFQLDHHHHPLIQFDQIVCSFDLDFLLSFIEFHKVCICDGFWMTDFLNKKSKNQENQKSR